MHEAGRKQKEGISEDKSANKSIIKWDREMSAFKSRSLMCVCWEDSVTMKQI